jgi:hypothetical protein
MSSDATSETKNNKCAHPACGCLPEAGNDYCSQTCKEAADLTEIACQCGHSGCAVQGARSVA